MSYELKQVSIRMVEQPPLIGDRAMDSPRAAVRVMADFLQTMDRELFCVVNLRNDLKPINMNIVSVGALNYSLVHPRELMKSAVLSNAASIMLLHNHPSGKVTPSKEDVRVTDRINRVCEIMGISLTDHLIVGHDREVYSFREHDKLQISDLVYIDDADQIDLRHSQVAESAQENIGKTQKKKRDDMSL